MTPGFMLQPHTSDPSRIIVVANRAPFSYERQPDGTIRVRRGAGGLITALEPLVKSWRGTWVGQASTSLEREMAAQQRSSVSDGDGTGYQLRYVSLREEEQCGYYYGFANEGLWPLCHSAGVEPVFRGGDFHMYRTANARFAAAVVEESDGCRPVVLVQDYHLALAPRLIRDHMPAATIVSFWHVPWPRPRRLGSCPWASDLIEGLLASDLLGFQTEDDCLNFFASVEAFTDGRVDITNRRVTYRGQTTRVGPYPVSIDWMSAVPAGTPTASECRRQVGEVLGLHRDVSVMVGVDRLDYTKGIVEKFLAFEKLLADQPEWRGRCALVQVAAPSRDRLPAYQQVKNRIIDTAARVNNTYGRSGNDGYRPIYLLDSHHDAEDVFRLYRASRVCIVSSLHDGMNLVAKEFVRARDDEQGVLALSQHTGAAQQLHGAQIINPRDIDGMAALLAESLVMPPSEQRRRMRLMRAEVADHDAAWWTRRLMSDATQEEARLRHGASVRDGSLSSTIVQAVAG